MTDPINLIYLCHWKQQLLPTNIFLSEQAGGYLYVVLCLLYLKAAQLDSSCFASWIELFIGPVPAINLEFANFFILPF